MIDSKDIFKDDIGPDDTWPFYWYLNNESNF